MQKCNSYTVQNAHYGYSLNSLFISVIYVSFWVKTVAHVLRENSIPTIETATTK